MYAAPIVATHLFTRFLSADCVCRFLFYLQWYTIVNVCKKNQCLLCAEMNGAEQVVNNVMVLILAIIQKKPMNFIAKIPQAYPL